MAHSTDVRLEPAAKRRDEASRTRRRRGVRVRSLLVLVAVCAGLLWARDEWERRSAVAAMEALVSNGTKVETAMGLALWLSDAGESFDLAVRRVEALHAQPLAVWRLRQSLRQNHAGEASTNRYNSAIALLIRLGPEARPAVPDLIETLQHNPSADVRGFAAQALALIGADDSATLPVLLSKIDSPNAPDIQSALKALKYLGVRAIPAIPAIIKVLSHDDPNVRVAAIESLWGMGNAPARKAVPALITLLNDPERRVWALESVSVIAPEDPRLGPALESLIKESDLEFQAEAGPALARIRSAQVVRIERERLRLIAAEHRRVGMPENTVAERP